MNESGAKPTVLVVDDDPSLTRTLQEFLEEEGYLVEIAHDGEEALAIQKKNPRICLALLDLMMPLTDGITLMEQLRREDPDLAVMIMTGFGTIETAVEAIKRGAEDYLTKPLEPEAVKKKVGRIVEVFRLRSRVSQLESHLHRCRPSFDSLVYVSPLMQRAVEKARTAAESDSPVLVLGETGTGKELLARAIHAASGRAANQFVPVNCGALPRELVESELFGYRRGAFTGAFADGAGIFASAARGTVFLDEIGEMPKEVQVKLLRVLQDKEVRPVGGTKAIPVDVRIIAATNRTNDELRHEQLRQDFYFRIATVVIEIPPLRARPEDILVFAQHTLQRLEQRYERHITLHRSALELLLKYAFPGNVRELENLLESLAALSRDDPQTITEKDLRPLLDPAGLADEPAAKGVGQTVAMEPLERMAIDRALRLAEGNRSKAAALLGISRDTLYRKMREYRTEP
ncbi:MAG: sigma-54 dependent transcriptional regulator [Acidobacteriia bacterium]|nr:sigma-54 dependent transcriptional regulator [Terriglobia bacterium]